MRAKATGINRKGSRPICADCGIDTIEIREWYIVNEDVWEQAWRGRRKFRDLHVPGELPFEIIVPDPAAEILCIGCLEARLGRALVKGDFTDDVPINNPDRPGTSARLRDRLGAKSPASSPSAAGFG